jgi:hypothetical protein
VLQSSRSYAPSGVVPLLTVLSSAHHQSYGF